MILFTISFNIYRFSPPRTLTRLLCNVLALFISFYYTLLIKSLGKIKILFCVHHQVSQDCYWHPLRSRCMTPCSSIHVYIYFSVLICPVFSLLKQSSFLLLHSIATKQWIHSSLKWCFHWGSQNRGDSPDRTTHYSVLRHKHTHSYENTLIGTNGGRDKWPTNVI